MYLDLLDSVHANIDCPERDIDSTPTIPLPPSPKTPPPQITRRGFELTTKFGTPTNYPAGCVGHTPFLIDVLQPGTAFKSPQ